MLDSILSTEIYLPHHICPDEAIYLVNKFEILDKAKTMFMSGTVSFADYIDVLDMFDVDIDDYLDIVESNLRLFGVQV